VKKIIFLLLTLAILLFGCSQGTFDESAAPNPAPKVTMQEENLPDPSQVKPILIYTGRNKGYVIGGLVEGKFISVQEDNNYKMFKVLDKDNYIFYAPNGESVEIANEVVNTYWTPATGSYDVEVSFKDTSALDPKGRYIALAKFEKEQAWEKKVLDENGSFELDFDGDGSNEKIIVNKTGNNVSLNVENQNGNSKIIEFEVDDVYISTYDVYTLDVNEDDAAELIILLKGHRTSAGIYKINSTSCEKILGYNLKD